MDAVRPEAAGHGFREAALGRLGGAVRGPPQSDAVAPMKMMVPAPACFIAGTTCWLAARAP